MKKNYLLNILFVLSAYSLSAQSSLSYQDFHLEQSSGVPNQYTIILQTNFIIIDTVNYMNYTLTSQSLCTGTDMSMNSLAYYSVTTPPPSGFGASNIYETYQVPARHYYLSNSTGVYDNGYDWSYYDNCQNYTAVYTDSRITYSYPQQIINYPIHIGSSFTDSSYCNYIRGWGGCPDPGGPLHTDINSNQRSLILRKVLNTGRLITPCASYDSVYFIRQKFITDEQRQVHTSGMDSLYHIIDTTYIEKYKINETNIIGIVKNHPYFLFSESTSEINKYFPDSSSSVQTYAQFFFLDPFASVAAITNNINTIVFPNPGNGIFTLTSYSPIKSVEIMNSLGQVVHICKNEKMDYSKDIDLSNIQDGIYTLRIIHEKTFEYKQIIKQ